MLTLMINFMQAKHGIVGIAENASLYVNFYSHIYDQLLEPRRLFTLNEFRQFLYLLSENYYNVFIGLSSGIISFP
jgi:hypothetical protein